MKEQSSPNLSQTYRTRSMNKLHPENFKAQRIFDIGLSNQDKFYYNNCPKNMVVLLRSPQFDLKIENKDGVAWKLWEFFQDRTILGNKNLLSVVFGNQKLDADKFKKNKDVARLRQILKYHTSQQIERGRKMLRQLLLRKYEKIDLEELINEREKCWNKEDLKNYIIWTMQSLKKDGKVPVKLDKRSPQKVDSMEQEQDVSLINQIINFQPSNQSSNSYHLIPNQSYTIQNEDISIYFANYPESPINYPLKDFKEPQFDDI